MPKERDHKQTVKRTNDRNSKSAQRETKDRKI